MAFCQTRTPAHPALQRKRSIPFELQPSPSSDYSKMSHGTCEGCRQQLPKLEWPGDDVRRKRSLRSRTNPSATQQHHVRSMMHQMQARTSPYNNTASNFNFHSSLPFSGEGWRQHFPQQQRPGAGRLPFQSSKPGGTLVVLWRPTATPTNRDNTPSPSGLSLPRQQW